MRGECGRALKLPEVWEGCQGKCHDRQPDSGNPTVRDENGGLRKRGLWWNCEPTLLIERAGLETLHLWLRAPQFYPKPPLSTIDLNTPSGKAIPIEHRNADELLDYAGKPIAPNGTHADNPVFDITPAELIDVIVTEKGIIRAPNEEKIRALIDK